ncbi:MAG TPA: endopeptidase La [Coxiellaceae bacterium]|nr:endopeptidase La [Coxiellaceae bacterium]
MPDSKILPLLPLRDVVVFPDMVLPLFVGRQDSIHALLTANEKDKRVFLLTQRDAKIENPKPQDLYEVGTIAKILQLLRLPDDTVKVLVEGIERARIIDTIPALDHLKVSIKPLPSEIVQASPELQTRMRYIVEAFSELVKINKKIPKEILSALSAIEDPYKLINSIASHLTVKLSARQELLEMTDTLVCLNALQVILEEEIQLGQLEKYVQTRIKEQVAQNQKQYYLNEKLKAIKEIQKEIGGSGEKGGNDDLDELANRIKVAGMSHEAEEKATTELEKLKLMPAMSAEATVVRNYLDVLLGVPWRRRSKVTKDLKKARKTLDDEHYGLDKIKERILEFLAVSHRVKKLKGPILCLVGPPGVGKTSLGQSIAHATGRKFARISLGGVRDEAEIRGHRRTYIGAMPGKIIQKITKAKVKNPLIMLDEVDKMTMDFRGDPASALLEVLDPEQNSAFNDHYLEVDYDLSQTMFIATANSMDIPAPLLDRMEVIRLAGYTEDEKLHIALQHLIPKQKEQAGLKKRELNISPQAVRNIIRYYTREAGVRSLEREIAKICRKVVKALVTTKNPVTINITHRNLEKYLGIERFRFGVAETENRVGQVTGLAWTEVGGDILTIEAQVVPGKGKTLYTGSLGDVMQESIHTAMTVARSRAASLGITNEVFQDSDMHVHVPEGATPKDGPSAGIGMCTALVSALTHIPVRAEVAMTGEITLRGEVLPIGGLKEKLLAALRAGIKHVIIPKENERELKEIPKEVTQSLSIHAVQWIDEVFDLALTEKPKPLLQKTTPFVPPTLQLEETVNTH